MTVNIAILLVEEKQGWSARSADVLDVYAVGKTREEACDRLREALRLHLEVLRERSLPIPSFTAQVGATNAEALAALSK
jgi:predicted RNase H-like HicB family nuclease